MAIDNMGNALKETKEFADMTHNPMVKEWGLYFYEANGYDNRLTVAKAFTDFWDNSSADKLEIPGKCTLGGKVFGHEKFNDGEEIFTSDIISIERIERGYVNGITNDLLRVTTVSGSKYHIYSINYNAYMFLMMGDLIHLGELNPSRHYYLKPEYRCSKLI